MQVMVIDMAGVRHEIGDGTADSVMEIIRNEGVMMAAQCGGSAACGTCQVYVDAAWLDRLAPPSADEAVMLEFVEELRPESRLSCQLMSCDALNGIIVTLAPGTEF